MGYRIESVLVPTLDPILWFVLFTLDIDGQAITLVWRHFRTFLIGREIQNTQRNGFIHRYSNVNKTNHKLGSSTLQKRRRLAY